MGPRDYFDIVRRHARPIAAIAVLCAVAALVTSLSVTPVYQADAKLLVLAKSDPEGGTSSAYEGALLSQQLVKSFVQVLQSRPTAEAALRGDPDPISVDALQQRVHADPIPETLLIRLSVDDVDPDRARRLTNSVASAFIKRLPKLQSGSAVRVSLVEPPRRPLAPVKPRIPLNVALGLVLGLLVGTGLALLRDFLDRSIRSPERLEAASGTPVVGTIPPFNAGELPTPVTEQPRSAAAEAFRKLRTNFSFLGVDRESIACVVTSPAAGDGKSTVAANLALALAETGIRVVVVDADLRRPAQHRIFRLQERVGTTTVLLQQADLADALQPVGAGSLAVLTAGQLPINPAELLASRRMAELVRWLRGTADVILLDCPPLLPVTDPMVAARCADGALLVARADVTTTDQVQAARSVCGKAGVALFGTILNASVVSEGQQPTQYGGYYYYHDGEDPVRAGRRGRPRTRPHHNGSADSAGLVAELDVSSAPSVDGRRGA
jgi:capsular exopolysaccharide synthesis family protein